MIILSRRPLGVPQFLPAGSFAIQWLAGQSNSATPTSLRTPCGNAIMIDPCPIAVPTP